MSQAKQQLKEDFPEIDAKTLFRNPNVMNGPKAPKEAQSGMGGTAATPQRQASVTQVLAEKYGYQRPSERKEQNVSDIAPMAPQPYVNYEPHSNSLIGQQPVYSQYMQPQQYQQPMINVEMYKQAIGGLLDVLANNVTHAEWQSNPAIVNAIRVLQ